MPGEMQRLQALKRQLEDQNQAWERMKNALSRLGDVCLQVPRESLDALDEATTPPAVDAAFGVRG